MDQVISQPFFTGMNSSNASARGVEMFRNAYNHVDAVSSILTYIGNQTNFHPFSQSPSEGAKHYFDYVQRVSTFPAFRERSSIADAPLDISTSVLDGVKASYASVIAVDEAKMIESIKRMVNTLAQYGGDRSTTLFNQMSIKKEEGYNNIYVIIYYATINIWTTKEGKNTYSKHTQYTINIHVFDVITNYLVDNAYYLDNLVNKKALDDWLRENSSPTNPLWVGCSTF